ncbi:MAG: hypothetical protein A4S09_00980 [Proteobacteria bacterium SG_bin7]|nr:MAG: hypothetical protein A4S09_00980 [Proteobacteria bacterium SG_bin7]
MNKLLAIGFGMLLAANLASAEDLGKITGVGLAIEQKSERAFVIKDIVANSPAARLGGIEVGDMITEIKSLPTSNWERVYGKKLEEVVAQIRGPVGIPCEIKIYKPADHSITPITLIREELEMPDTNGLSFE